SSNHRSTPPPEATLTDSHGRSCALTSIANSHSNLFFSCGCSDCLKYGKGIAPFSRHFGLVSSQDPAATAKFAMEIGWRGDVFVDTGSKVSIALDALNCPRTFRCWRGQVVE